MILKSSVSDIKCTSVRKYFIIKIIFLICPKLNLHKIFKKNCEVCNEFVICNIWKRLEQNVKNILYFKICVKKNGGRKRKCKVWWTFKAAEKRNPQKKYIELGTSKLYVSTVLE